MSSNAEFEEFYGGAVGRLLGQLLLVTGDLHLLAALRTLPIRQRQVLVLHHLVGVPVEEVARTLSLPSGTVKSALACGRRALAVLLDDLEEVPGSLMSDLRERFQEVADAAAREGRTPGAAAAIRRARQRQRRLAGGVAALLVVLLLAGTIIVDRIAGGPDEPTSLPAVGPPSTQSLPGTGAVRTDQPPAGTPEHQLLRSMKSVLNRCRGGGAPELIGWVRAHGFTVMVAAKPPRPGEGWICQVGGYPHPQGGVNVGTERWVGEGLSPPSRKRLAATGGNFGLPADRGMLAYVQGYVTRQAARVRVLAKDGSPRLELGLVDPGDRYPVKFFIALFTVPSSDFPFATVEALDQAGRTVARCTAGAPPVGDCRDV